MKRSFGFLIQCRCFYVVGLVTILGLFGSLRVAQAQYTVQNQYMRVLFDDGFGNISYNVGSPGTDPVYGALLPAGSVTSANGLLMPIGHGSPSDTPYVFTQDTSSGGTANGASLNLNFIAFTYGESSNNLPLPFGSSGTGVSGGGLTQYLISGSKLGPARLRMDWTIEYVNNTFDPLSAANVAVTRFSVNLPNNGNYGQIQFHDVLTLSTGPTITIDNPQPGDGPSTGYVSGSFWRVNPQTTGFFTDFILCNDPAHPSVTPVSPGDSYTEQGYIDIQVDPASIQFNVAPVPKLAIVHSGSNIVVSWVASATGFNLQTNSDLTTSNWGNYGDTVNNDGTVKSVTTSLSAKNVFFRLSTQ
jgi:hypothetical protein